MDLEVGVEMDGNYVHALGYSLEHNPDFRYCYCADEATYKQLDPKFYDNVKSYWLPVCSMSGGSSGGPWVADMNTLDGTGKIVSVNSWSFGSEDGYGGPIIDASIARCFVNAAHEADYEALAAEPAGSQGVIVNCHDRPCVTPEEADDMENRGRGLRGQDNGLGDGRILCSTKTHD